MSGHFPSPSKRRFSLDKDNAWALGVCGGIAKALSIDPAVVRVATTIAGLFFWKTVAAVYLVAWLIMDERNI